MNIITVLIAFIITLIMLACGVVDSNASAICYMIMISTICITTEIKQNKK